MILLIDNYDSFTFNLVQYTKMLGNEVVVIRNDQLSILDIHKLNPTHIILSPGPGHPDTAGNCIHIVNSFYQDIPILGVCLGHQIIARAFGATIKKGLKPMHGKVSEINHRNKGVFNQLPTPLQVTRYHSLVVDESTLPKSLEITAKSKDGEIMGLRHIHYPVEGVQFHPESILTEKGLQIVENFLVKERTYAR